MWGQADILLKSAKEPSDGNAAGFCHLAHGNALKEAIAHHLHCRALLPWRQCAGGEIGAPCRATVFGSHVGTQSLQQVLNQLPVCTFLPTEKGKQCLPDAGDDAVLETLPGWRNQIACVLGLWSCA